MHIFIFIDFNKQIYMIFYGIHKISNIEIYVLLPVRYFSINGIMSINYTILHPGLGNNQSVTPTARDL